MGKKKKKQVRCEVCGAIATHYVLDTDCPACDNPVCENQLIHDIEAAVKQYKEQEEFERGREV